MSAKEVPIARYVEASPDKSEWNKTPDEYVSLKKYHDKQILELARHVNWWEGNKKGFVSITGTFTLTQKEGEAIDIDMSLSGQRVDGMSVYIHTEHDPKTLAALEYDKTHTVFRVIINPEKGAPIVGFMERAMVEEVDGYRYPLYELLKVAGDTVDEKSSVSPEEQEAAIAQKRDAVVAEFTRLKDAIYLLVDQRAEQGLPAPGVALRCSNVAEYL